MYAAANVYLAFYTWHWQSKWMNTSFQTKNSLLSLRLSSSRSFCQRISGRTTACFFLTNRVAVWWRDIWIQLINISNSSETTFPLLPATYVAIYWINCAKRPSWLIRKQWENTRATSGGSHCAREQEIKLERDLESDDIWSGLNAIRSGGRIEYENLQIW